MFVNMEVKNYYTKQPENFSVNQEANYLLKKKKKIIVEQKVQSY